MMHRFPPPASLRTWVDVEGKMCFFLSGAYGRLASLRHISRSKNRTPKKMNKISSEQTITAICPDCGERIDLGSQPQEEQEVTCPECWASLKVVSLDPPTLSWDTFEDEDEEN